ncbi:MAG: IS66 family transposase zinc-finger binding domain-containing protein [Verrucomicrobiales bacterium]|nr:IS66 family transposase zinc-finger binding domain-containing protein [Verrucomicrobiales bacterium]
MQRIPVGPHCPQCGGPLQDKGVAARSVLDVEPLRRQTLHYQLEQKYCPHCRQAVSARAPGFCRGTCWATGCWRMSRCSTMSTG